MIENPQIKIVLEYMRQEIVHAFTNRNVELSKEVQTVLDDVIKNFDWNSEINKMATGILHEEIRQSLTSAFQNIRWDEAIRKSLVQHILTELKK